MYLLSFSTIRDHRNDTTLIYSASKSIACRRPSNRGHPGGLWLELETSSSIRPVSISYLSPEEINPGLAAGWHRGTLTGQTTSRGFAGWDVSEANIVGLNSAATGRLRNELETSKW